MDKIDIEDDYQSSLVFANIFLSLFLLIKNNSKVEKEKKS